MYVDTNILIRAATRTPPDQAAAVEGLLRSAISNRNLILEVAASTVSETVFVLKGRTYSFSRADIVKFLETLLPLPIRISDRAVVERAIGLYREIHDDWDDCLVASYALAQSDGTIISFDRGLDRIPGLTRIDPSREATS